MLLDLVSLPLSAFYGYVWGRGFPALSNVLYRLDEDHNILNRESILVAVLSVICLLYAVIPFLSYIYLVLYHMAGYLLIPDEFVTTITFAFALLRHVDDIP